METIDSIPISKIQRAGKIIQTGAKVGANYLKYYGDKVIAGSEKAKENLDAANAEDVYDGLKKLKGSALKVAQMLSMEKNIVPEAFSDKFSLSQFSVPPLSPPLVTKTLKNSLGKAPHEIFERFDTKASNAASIGQVHRAGINGTKYAVKIQYPGVAESISSDLALVKPVAMKMFNIKGEGSDKYFKEVEDKLIEETNYLNEIEESIFLSENCAHLPNLRFPKYYPELSSERIITMDWMEGIHLSEFIEQNPDKDIANMIGQTLWDFYMYQIHTLKKVHADPHPGNFLVNKENELVVLDFGCIKTIPEDFYTPYFELSKEENLNNPERFTELMYEVEIITKDDTKEHQKVITDMFHQILSHFSQPLRTEYFDFSNPKFIEQFAELGTMYAKVLDKMKINSNRGSRHFIYMNRTFFGLYNLLNMLGAQKVRISTQPA
jgi:predicted unusual protein kinase regulating ubiquinone biosynthesis (AarF/ABC1/UbiB family)